jgi:hypothetical protein
MKKMPDDYMKKEEAELMREFPGLPHLPNDFTESDLQAQLSKSTSRTESEIYKRVVRAAIRRHIAMN